MDSLRGGHEAAGRPVRRLRTGCRRSRRSTTEIDDRYRFCARCSLHRAAKPASNTQPNQAPQKKTNTDERGSREYNIGLGERRAKAVAEMMKLMGVSADQISTVSYGEERPAALGHDESAWHLNRRVEIVYGGP